MAVCRLASCSDSPSAGPIVGGLLIRIPVQLDGRGDLDDILAGLAFPVSDASVDAEPVCAEPKQPSDRLVRALRSECFPFPATR
jgi:hypothetical protein